MAVCRDPVRRKFPCNTFPDAIHAETLDQPTDGCAGLGSTSDAAKVILCAVASAAASPAVEA